MAPQATPNPLAMQRTLGPVSDLERHLPPDWWRSLFNSVYLKTDGDVVENDESTQREVSTIVQLAELEENDRILDLCCGQGRHSLELARRGFRHVMGLDRSRYLIRLARQRARRRKLPLQFREGDARRLPARDGEFHCVLILGNSFGYFERAEDDLQVLHSCLRALRPGGTLVLDITDGDWVRDHYDPRSWEWIDQNHFVCRERSLSENRERLISREVITHVERGVIIDQFYAERLYNRPGIEALLREAGFGEIRFHREIEGESTRNHDLGMMARRLLLTAHSPRSAAASASRKVLFPDVTVLMGDPSLPDTVKRDGQFNPEDFETIKRLRKALGEIDGHRFEFFDDHASLLYALKSNPPSFVLNLCDEGYRNDAFLELHVPAYLEMLGIPYTGAGPSCLGLCYNKALVRAIAESLGIPTPLETFISPADQSATLPGMFPALIKPNFGDSSIGITQDAVVHRPEQLIDYINHLKQSIPDRPLLVQEFLGGAEYSVGIVGNPRLTVHFLPILEVDYSDLPPELPRILGYESKWLPDSPYWTRIQYRQAELSEESARVLLDQSMLLFEQLGCRDYARFDFRANAAGEIKLLEVNPNPGWCWDGKMNYMAGFEGLRYTDLLGMILEVAQERVAAGNGAAVSAGD